MTRQLPTIEPTDAELLMRFTRGGDEEAFRLLVERHTPLVHTVCRRVLAQQQDVEDAFQATFLVLARESRTIRCRDSVSAWLFKIAHRTAVRAARQRRKRGEKPLPDDLAIPSPTLGHLEDRETFEVLAVELNRLPERYRTPLVLFYLEGMSRRAAADQLDLTDAALKARLAQGRKLLRERLLRRGIALSLAMTAVTAAPAAADAALSASLIEQTISAGLSLAATGKASSACSSHIVSLSEGVRTMLSASLTKPALAAGILLTAGLLTAIGVGAHSLRGEGKRIAPAVGAQTPRVIQTVVDASTAAPPGAAEPLIAQAEVIPAELDMVSVESMKARLEQILAETTDIHFDETTLKDAAEFLAARHNVSFTIDEYELAAAGKSSDAPVTMSVTGVKLQSALQVMLEPLGLTFFVDADHGALTITTDARLEKRRKAHESRLEKRKKAQRGGAAGVGGTPALLEKRRQAEQGDAAGANGAPADLKARSPAEQKFEEALTQTTEIEFVDTALKDAMEFLADRHKIPILLDDTALSEEGIATDEPITQVLSGVRLSSALNIILDPLKLTWLIEDDVMKIVPVSAAGKRIETRVYTVASLLNAGFDAELLAGAIEEQTQAKVTVLEHVLVVTQSQPQHRKTAELLEQLHRAAEHGRPQSD